MRNVLTIVKFLNARAALRHMRVINLLIALLKWFLRLMVSVNDVDG